MGLKEGDSRSKPWSPRWNERQREPISYDSFNISMGTNKIMLYFIMKRMSSQLSPCLGNLSFFLIPPFSVRQVTARYCLQLSSCWTQEAGAPSDTAGKLLNEFPQHFGNGVFRPTNGGPCNEDILLQLTRLSLPQPLPHINSCHKWLFPVLLLVRLIASLSIRQ